MLLAARELSGVRIHLVRKADALAALVAREEPPAVSQSGAASAAYAGRALRDPTRAAELAGLLDELARVRSG